MTKIKIKAMIETLEQAATTCRDCGCEWGIYSVGCSSVWQGICQVCGETKGVTETRDYGYFITGIRKLKMQLKELS
jgi:hypothetical protein